MRLKCSKFLEGSKVKLATVQRERNLIGVSLLAETKLENTEENFEYVGTLLDEQFDSAHESSRSSERRVVVQDDPSIKRQTVEWKQVEGSPSKVKTVLINVFSLTRNYSYLLTKTHYRVCSIGHAEYGGRYM
ncbi:hypothetical protein J6590_068501 [Homalodisca vitripennis]|nr:hypothetical protein J6590_068501 [Homalodisca vitripennis]